MARRRDLPERYPWIGVRFPAAAPFTMKQTKKAVTKGIKIPTVLKGAVLPQMKKAVTKAVIFDFNRTLWEDGDYLDGALDVLRSLQAQGFKLGLVSSVEAHEIPERKEIIRPIEPLFHSVNVVTKKSKDVFQQVAEELGVKHSEILVVGDRLNNEIMYGNQLGMKTVWLKRGKNATKLPESSVAEPHHTISSLKELQWLLK